jgi:hypothetical protein
MATPAASTVWNGIRGDDLDNPKLAATQMSDQIWGIAGIDRLFGNESADLPHGGSATTSCSGPTMQMPCSAGPTLEGDAGIDSVEAGKGQETLYGGGGADSLGGGDGWRDGSEMPTRCTAARGPIPLSAAAPLAWTRNWALPWPQATASRWTMRCGRAA